VTAGKEGTPFTLSALEIRKISDVPVTTELYIYRRRFDSLQLYPLDTSAQAGWGQMLHKFVDTNVFQIRNMASSGQFARGFRDDGQFEAIMKYLKPGDIFILQFGINDTNSKTQQPKRNLRKYDRHGGKGQSYRCNCGMSTPQGRATDFNSSNVHDSKADGTEGLL